MDGYFYCVQYICVAFEPSGIFTIRCAVTRLFVAHVCSITKLFNVVVSSTWKLFLWDSIKLNTNALHNLTEDYRHPLRHFHIRVFMCFAQFETRWPNRYKFVHMYFERLNLMAHCCCYFGERSRSADQKSSFEIAWEIVNCVNRLDALGWVSMEKDEKLRQPNIVCNKIVK